jgi:DNA adenine methylase
MDARFNRSCLTSQIESIARFKHRVNLYHLDAVSFVRTIAPELPVRALIYLDPPYVVKGKRLYLNAYDKHDHAEIAQVIQKFKRVPWIVSYDNEKLIRDLYCERRKLTYKIGYSANLRSHGSEIVVFSDAIKIPDVESPLSIHGVRLRELLKAA